MNLNELIASVRKKPLTPAQKAIRKANGEKHQRAFMNLWMRLDGPHIEDEVCLTPNRRLRWDFACIPAKCCFEIQGGIWGKKSGHNSGTGIIRDTRKARLATLAGWSHFQIVPEDINTKVVSELIEFTRRKMG